VSIVKEQTLVSTNDAGEVGEVVNDFSILVATVNGSGSQSANNVLMRAIFHMGVPVSGKNLFPSNIAGLPTWFTLRASAEGFIGRKKEIDILVAMNRQTVQQDVESVEPGGLVLYEEKLKASQFRDDLVYFAIPFTALAREIVEDSRLRKLVTNMVYVGSVAQLLGIPMEQVRRGIEEWFDKKPKAVRLNVRAAELGAEYVAENFPRASRYRLQPMDKTKGKIIIDGNSASAMGCLFAGVSVMTWYPITPSSSMAEQLTSYLNRFRMDPETGKALFAVIQAEDELAAIGMTLGAGWAGARSMTTTSGPGISLMSEFAGFGYFAEIPCVIFDVQRVGPSTGLPTRTSQGDIFSLYFLSHGDTRHLVLLPADMTECFDMAWQAFDLAEEFQQPVFVASDLDLGMNNWMADPFEYPQKTLNRGKVLDKDELERIGEFARYKDIDKDGIPYRTLPGTEHPLAAYFTRGSGHDETAAYTESPEAYTRLMDRLSRKHETAKTRIPQPVVEFPEGAEIGVIAFGSTHWAIEESLLQLKREYGTELGYLRVRALPLTVQIEEFVQRCDRVYVVEQNRDGQLADLIRMELPDHAGRIRKILHYDGLPIDARFVTDRIVEAEGFEKE
jgi:2-oxoglutarate ferredoxin oxidoreductase subunit alpha